MASDVMDALTRVLQELGPENLDPSAVTVTGEGAKVEIVIVPHRDLGGVSLVLWTDDRGTEILWAGISDLSTHDDIDLGIGVARVPNDGAWTDMLVEALASELRRPIYLKRHRGVLGSSRVDCYVVLENDNALWLRALRPAWTPGAPETTSWEAVTSLASGPRLPFSIPPQLENWRRNR